MDHGFFIKAFYLTYTLKLGVVCGPDYSFLLPRVAYHFSKLLFANRVMFNFKWPSKEVAFSKELLNSLYRYALSLSNDEQQAYDLVQSCCEKALKKNIAAGDLKPYMYKSIRNQYIDMFRRKKLELVVDSELEQRELIDEHFIVENLDQLMIDRQHLEIILQDIDYQDRELLYLWAVEGNSMQELAQRTNTSRNTLLSRLNRLRKRLNHKYSYLNEQVSKDG